MPVPSTTLEAYCQEQAVERVTLLKCDTEGHDFSVLEGATRLFRERRVDVCQFEYNWRWIDARRYLRDVFAFSEAAAYRIGKLTPHGVEVYKRWDPELESFREGNYVLFTEESSSWFAHVPWWNDPE